MSELPNAVRVGMKAGFLTRELCDEFLFSAKSRQGRDKAWKNLVQRGYFVPHRNSRLMNVIVPNRRNRSMMVDGNRVSNPPYESQLRHDEILLQGLLLAERTPHIEHWITEAELKADSQKDFRIANRDQKNKYSDSVIYVKSEQGIKKVAIEIELTMKSKKRYDQILTSYSAFKEIALVIFVTENPAIKETVRRSIESHFYPSGSMTVGFMNLSDWLKNPVTSMIDFGFDRGTLIQYVNAT